MYPDALKRQYVYETESWARLLEFFRQENVCFKTRLAEILHASADDDILEAAEKFLEDFLSQDRIIAFLERELSKQNQLLEKDFHRVGELFKEVVKNQKLLRSDMKKAEKIFTKVKDDFSEYLIDRF